MKRFPLLCFAAVCGLGALLQGQTIRLAKTTPFEVAGFSAKSGNWNKAANWANKQVPANSANGKKRVIAAVGNGREAVIDSPIPDVYGIFAGSEGASGKIEIREGARIEMKNGASFCAHRNLPNATAFIDMKGGELLLRAQDGCRIFVGSVFTHSGRGVMTVSGGVVQGGISVGSAVEQGNSGLLTVKGSAPKILGENPRCSFDVLKTGVLRFELEGEKTALMDYSGAPVRFEKGAVIEVDAKRFKNKRGTYTLLEGASIDNKGAVLKLENCPRGKLAFAGKRLVLKIE